MIILATMLIVIAITAKMLDNPVRQAEKRLERIANDYYVTYLYPRLLGRLDNDPEKMLSQYDEYGVTPVYLRQLLHYNNDEQASAAKVFERIDCNTNSTGVKFWPVEPYGPRDYRTELIWNCSKKD